MIVFFSVTFLFLGPIETIAANVATFNITPKESFGVFFILTLLAIIALTAILGLMPKKLRDIITALIFGISFAGYLQAN